MAMTGTSFLGRGVTVLALLAAIGAAAQTGPAPAASAAPPAAAHKNLAPGFAGPASGERILLMPVDVELFSLSAGGIAEPRADWTQAAQAHVKAAIAARTRTLRLSTVEGSEALADEFAEQVGLHAAVAGAIALHHGTGGIWALPTKAGQLLWSFDDAMQPLAARTGARYGLFVRIRDSYASAERKAMMIGLTLLGVGVGGGVQVGYASLVDLQTGQVVWFNRLARATGDLRESASATESIDALLAGFPAAR